MEGFWLSLDLTIIACQKKKKIAILTIKIHGSVRTRTNREITYHLIQ